MRNVFPNFIPFLSKTYTREEENVFPNFIPFLSKTYTREEENVFSILSVFLSGTSAKCVFKFHPFSEQDTKKCFRIHPFLSSTSEKGKNPQENVFQHSICTKPENFFFGFFSSNKRNPGQIKQRLLLFFNDTDDDCGEQKTKTFFV